MRLASVLTVVSTAFREEEEFELDRILDQTHITDDGIYDFANKVAVRQRTRDQVERFKPALRAAQSVQP
jgi:hypothetical protein